MRRPLCVPLLAFLLFMSLPAESRAQNADRLRISAPGGAVVGDWPVVLHRGYPAVPSAVLAAVGWRLETGPELPVATLPGGVRLELHPGAPFVRLDGVWAQLTAAPYALGDTLYLPIQLFTDLLPDRLPDLYAALGSHELVVVPDSLRGTGADAAIPFGGPDTQVALERPEDPRDDGVRVVIIDPGHGGVDPGSLGPGRTREKDVTLAVGLALAKALEGEPGLEVHLTRNSDVLVPLWERGEIATRLKDDRYGIFLSIHANAVTRREVRGVETYFLDEARTEHEARVAALENSAMELERGRSGGPAQGEMDFIRSDLRNRDFQHWSADLAARIQGEMARMHPGPNRGVKQGPLAVLTNAMMPSALIEVGFITNPTEERIISDPTFHREVAEAIAAAVVDFFERYPPGGAQGRTPR